MLARSQVFYQRFQKPRECGPRIPSLSLQSKGVIAYAYDQMTHRALNCEPHEMRRDQERKHKHRTSSYRSVLRKTNGSVGEQHTVQHVHSKAELSEQHQRTEAQELRDQALFGGN